MKKHTIFILITSGFCSRNIFQTDVFEVLKSSGQRLVFFVPPEALDQYDSYRSENVLFFEYKKPQFVERKFRSLRLLNSFSQGTTFKLDTQTIRDKRKILKSKGLFSFYFLRFFTYLVSFDFVGKILRELEWFIFPKRWLVDFFVKYEPDLLFSTDPFFVDETVFLEYAKKHKIKICSQILSWDNLTNRGYLCVLPDRVIVWNDIMKKQFQKVYKFYDDKIFISGVGHFDHYFKSTKISKEKFFEDNGLDPHKKLISFFTGSPGNFPTENELLLQIIPEMFADLELKDIFQILIRLNPLDKIERYAKLLSLPGVKIQRIKALHSSYRDNWNPGGKEVADLAAFLKYSDVLLGMSSTIFIEASISGTPQIMLDIDKNMSYYYRMDHFRPIFESGCATVVKDIDSTLVAVKKYLKNPKSNEEGRRSVVLSQCVFTDGGSGKRIAEYILDQVRLPL